MILKRNKMNCMLAFRANIYYNNLTSHFYFPFNAFTLERYTYSSIVQSVVKHWVGYKVNDNKIIMFIACFY